ncbi:single-stranded DNA-binding protein [Paenarthrobacter nitroguajacolicus]|uniref:single-stranded DNA-binding protein n=1 Tax=Paenarthrobacter nitroguajacolicus TaxID=211146 RepID=UPI00248C3437|nr:single-stranded DNA-binding protein [Paenarthrobacter nitroguajacolicus]MDI2037162.1 Single-stranded DNA-binding protein [Paenarthrobacter nitroguajacolicus]
MRKPHPVDGFTITPRIPLEVDLFRETNPSGRIYPDTKEEPLAGIYGLPYPVEDDRYLDAITRAPIGAGGLWDKHTADQHQPNDLTHDAPGGTEPQNETSTDTENTTSARGKGTIMAGETTITVIGNLTNDPELRFTPSGSAVANFTIASTPRTFDRQSNEWKDGETLFLRASVWREAAENVSESLTKGTRVIVSGRLKSRSYETKEGEKRTVIELEVDEIGPSLRYANAKVNRTQRNNQGGGNAGGFGNQPSTGQPVQQDDPWAANTSANAGSWGNGPDSEPPF